VFLKQVQEATKGTKCCYNKSMEAAKGTEAMDTFIDFLSALCGLRGFCIESIFVASVPLVGSVLTEFQ
jgi:hypothetical protein